MENEAQFQAASQVAFCGYLGNIQLYKHGKKTTMTTITNR